MKVATGIAEPFTPVSEAISFSGVAIVFENPPAIYEKKLVGKLHIPYCEISGKYKNDEKNFKFESCGHVAL